MHTLTISRDVSFEATTVVLVWASHLLLTPLVLSKDMRVALAGLALLVGTGVAFMWTRNVNLVACLVCRVCVGGDWCVCGRLDHPPKICAGVVRGMQGSQGELATL